MGVQLVQIHGPSVRLWTDSDESRVQRAGHTHRDKIGDSVHTCAQQLGLYWARNDDA